MQPLRALDDVYAGPARYVLRAWLVAVLPSLVFFGVRVGLGSASLHPPAVADVATFAAYSILVAPVIETALMFPVALLLRRLPGQSDWPRVLALAALAALVHGFGGSAWQVVGVFWPFVVYSAAFFAWSRHSYRHALLITGAIHALYNATFFLVGVLAAALVPN
ncbi:MAG: hypothetical protein IT521_04390 [Burkholderiales bacterium]|nr:hypothetical protein [Burkholderiales bacterium]